MIASVGVQVPTGFIMHTETELAPGLVNAFGILSGRSDHGGGNSRCAAAWLCESMRPPAAHRNVGEQDGRPPFEMQEVAPASAPPKRSPLASGRDSPRTESEERFQPLRILPIYSQPPRNHRPRRAPAAAPHTAAARPAQPRDLRRLFSSGSSEQVE